MIHGECLQDAIADIFLILAEALKDVNTWPDLDLLGFVAIVWYFDRVKYHWISPLDLGVSAPSPR